MRFHLGTLQPLYWYEHIHIFKKTNTKIILINNFPDPNWVFAFVFVGFVSVFSDSNISAATTLCYKVLLLL